MTSYRQRRLVRSVFVLLVSYLTLKSLLLLRPVIENSFVHIEHWHRRMSIDVLVGLLLVATLALLVGVVESLRSTLPEMDFPSFLIASAGWGITILLFLHTLAFRMNAVTTRLFLVLPGTIALATIVIVARRQSTWTLRPPGSCCGRESRRQLQWRSSSCPLSPIGWFWIAILGFLLVDAFVWLAALKASASGDEAFFWWSSLDYLQRHGVTQYFNGYAASNYEIGYPALGTMLMAWVPRPFLRESQLFLPFLLGGLLVWLIFLSGARIHVSQPSIALASLLTLVLLFQHRWIETMLFRLWYGEAMEIIAITCLFLFFFYDVPRFALRQPNLGRSSTTAFVGSYLAFGLGAFAAASKPPLSTLLVPAVVPCLGVVGTVLARRGTRAHFLAALGLLSLGALSVELLFARALGAAGRVALHSLNPKELLIFHPHGAISHLVPYFLTDYKNVWILSVLFVCLAVTQRARLHLTGLVVSGGLFASVLILYATMWHQVEYESGARYLSTVCYGWLIYYVGAERRFLVANLSWVTAGILGMLQRVKLWFA